MEVIATSFLIAFIMLFIFMFGVKVGINVNKNQEVKMNPVTIVKEHVETKREEKKEKEQEEIFNEGLQNIMSYDGSEQK